MPAQPLDARSGAARRLPGGPGGGRQPVRTHNPVLRETLSWPEPPRSGKMTPLPPIKGETQ